MGWEIWILVDLWRMDFGRLLVIVWMFRIFINPLFQTSWTGTFEQCSDGNVMTERG